MTKRQAITPAMKIDCLLYRLAGGEHIGIVLDDTGAVRNIFFRCGICGMPLLPEQPLQWDHTHAVSMAGPHIFTNLRPTHKACNQTKGIKEHRAKAKVDRILGLTCNGPTKKIPSRPMQNSGRKLPSRPFPKRKAA